MGRIEELAARYRGHIGAPWQRNLAGDQKAIFVVYPKTDEMKLRSDFVQYAAGQVRLGLTADGTDEDTVIAVQGVACLFGFTRVSLILKEVVKDIRGRLVVFFPGEYEDNNYRLLDARDGWNYLAVPITLHNGVND